VVVDYEDVQSGHGVIGMAASMSVPPASCAPIVNLPPSASTRLRMEVIPRPLTYGWGMPRPSSAMRRRGPTLDGRAKLDVVAPGEWICSAATGLIRVSAGLAGRGVKKELTYSEQSGTSVAASHAPYMAGVTHGLRSGDHRRQCLGMHNWET
jgi:Subtilase family